MNIRIAVAEDHSIFREGIKTLLSKVPDFEITGLFADGKQLVDSLSSINPDVILIDIDMPVINGIDATKIITATRPEVNVIALSMYNDQKNYYAMITAGAKGFVMKQSSVEELEKAIREVAAGNNYFSPDLLCKVIFNMQNIEKIVTREKAELLKISKKESELLQYIAQGLTNSEIAEKQFISVKTVESHKSKLMEKTNTRNNAGLIIWAIKNKFVEI